MRPRSTPIRVGPADMTFNRRLERIVSSAPDLPFLVTPEPVTYGELWRRAGAFACVLRARGVTGPAPIAISVWEEPFASVACVGAMLTGAPAAFLPREASAQELSARLAMLPPAIEIGDRSGDAAWPRLSTVTAEALLADALAAGPDTEIGLPQATATDFAQIRASSGSTGAPKLFLVDQAAQLARCLMRIRESGLARGDGLATLIGSEIDHWRSYALAAGARFHPVFDVGVRDLLGSLERVLEEGPTHAVASPREIGLLVWQIGDAGPMIAGSQLRRLLVRGSRADPETCRQFEEATGIEILLGYSANDAGAIACAGPALGARRFAVTGRLHEPDCVRIVDDAGDALPAGREGHVQVNSPQLARRVIEDGRAWETFGTWYDMGDLGRIEDGDVLVLTGRSKQVIKVAGLSVAPGEIEAALKLLPGIAEAAVVGIPHPTSGEQVVACLRLHDGVALDASDVHHHCWTLPEIKRPGAVLFFENLPTTRGGKVRLDELRRLATGRLISPAGG